MFAAFLDAAVPPSTTAPVSPTTPAPSSPAPNPTAVDPTPTATASPETSPAGTTPSVVDDVSGSDPLPNTGASVLGVLAAGAGALAVGW